jgi:DNA-directed RNA polymerase subunit RPC12/RpoP
LVKIAILRYNRLTRISEGMNMEAQARDEMNTDDRRCPKCGFEETGYFCRNCGGLLHDDELVLCPRCRQVVPGAEYCNQCGQALGNLALTLQQLALAGDAFWIAGETVPPPSSQELSFLVPDESVDLAPAELPDWLRELPAGSAECLSSVDAHPGRDSRQQTETLPDRGHPADGVVAPKRHLYGALCHA